jgi:WD40 repeat protein
MGGTRTFAGRGDLGDSVSLHFSPDGRFPVLGDDNGTLELLDRRTLARSVQPLSETALHDQELSVRMLLFLPSGHLLVGTGGGAIHEFEIARP